MTPGVRHYRHMVTLVAVVMVNTWVVNVIENPGVPRGGWHREKKLFPLILSCGRQSSVFLNGSINSAMMVVMIS